MKVVYRSRMLERRVETLDPMVRGRLQAAIEALADEPRPLGARPIWLDYKGGSAFAYLPDVADMDHIGDLRDARRIRIGAWRVIYLIVGDEVRIEHVGHRRDVYRRL